MGMAACMVDTGAGQRTDDFSYFLNVEIIDSLIPCTFAINANVRIFGLEITTKFCKVLMQQNRIRNLSRETKLLLPTAVGTAVLVGSITLYRGVTP